MILVSSLKPLDTEWNKHLCYFNLFDPKIFVVCVIEALEYKVYFFKSILKHDVIHREVLLVSMFVQCVMILEIFDLILCIFTSSSQNYFNFLFSKRQHTASIYMNVILSQISMKFISKYAFFTSFFFICCGHWSINWMMFYAISAMLQPYNSSWSLACTNLLLK